MWSLESNSEISFFVAHWLSASKQQPFSDLRRGPREIEYDPRLSGVKHTFGASILRREPKAVTQEWEGVWGPDESNQ